MIGALTRAGQRRGEGRVDGHPGVRVPTRPAAWKSGGRFTRRDRGYHAGFPGGTFGGAVPCEKIRSVPEPAFETTLEGGTMTGRRMLAAAIVIGLSACGGGGAPASEPNAAPPADAPAPAATVETFGMPDWMQVDSGAETVVIDLVAGLTDDNNRWNFNGVHSGRGGITVPAGYTVTVNFQNTDGAMAHSVGVDAKSDSYPNVFSDVVPQFAGGVTADPTSMMDATMPGEAEQLTFVADAPGEYVLICYVTGHAALGMWIDFNVSADGEAGALM